MSNGKNEEGRKRIADAMLARDKQAKEDWLNPNAVIQRRERIKAVLDGLAGRDVSIPQRNALAEFGGAPMGFGGLGFGPRSRKGSALGYDTEADPYPDFENAGSWKPYGELKKTLAKLKKTEKTAFALLLNSSELKEIDGLNERIDFYARKYKKDELEIKNILIMNGTAEGVHESLIVYIVSIRDVMKMIESQIEFYFPDKSRRGPRINTKAHAIAYRLAKFYALHRGEKPTWGTEYGTLPSTTYTRALQEIFEIQGVKAGIREPAEAACKRIDDEDLIQPRDGYSGLLNALAGKDVNVKKKPSQ